VSQRLYTTQLQAGLGLVNETRELLELWAPGRSASELTHAALASGRFPTITARRLRNIIAECFAPRYLVADGAPALYLKCVAPALNTAEFTQILLLHTARANPILGDFIKTVYWSRYTAGYSLVTTDDARGFVERAVEDGKTVKRWANGTIRRVAAYLTGCCADYGLLERGRKSVRQIVPFRIAPATASYLAHALHFDGLGDNAILGHPDWEIFGLSRDEVLEELKRLSLTGVFILQSAGELVRISWKRQSMEELCDVIAQS
jgi:hypothetical protein